MFENIQEIINELHRMKKEYNAPQGCCVRTQERNGYRSKCLSIAIKALSEVKTLAQAKTEGRLVEVVRCGECRHYNTTGCSDGCGWCENMDRGVFDEHYCSRGERREKE